MLVMDEKCKRVEKLIYETDYSLTIRLLVKNATSEVIPFSKTTPPPFHGKTLNPQFLLGKLEKPQPPLHKVGSTYGNI